MRCAWSLKNYEHSISNADLVISDIKSKAEQIWEARRIRSFANFTLGNDDKALDDYKIIAKYAESEQGAEALYYISKIHFNKESYEEVEKTTDKLMSYKYASKFWMTKGLLLMCDVYIIQNKTSDAEALLHTIIDSTTDQNLKNEAQLKLDNVQSSQNSRMNSENKESETEIKFEENN